MKRSDFSSLGDFIFHFVFADSTSSITQSTGHHTMEFFEMCAALITQLAR